MKVIHLSAECYPIAKVGGLGDVVGALPKYLNLAGLNAPVVMPYYNRKFNREHTFDVVFQGSAILGFRPFNFEVLKATSGVSGFELFVIRIPGLLDREEVYGYADDTDRFTAFQLAFLDWINAVDEHIDIIHCHDHHTGLIPFLLYYSRRYQKLSGIPTVCTIHNGQYQGSFGWDRMYYLPEIDLWKTGLLDWNGLINPLAAAVKCAWRYTTVSPSYLQELTEQANGLEALFRQEKAKGVGIINGIDTQVWDPEQDEMIAARFTASNVKEQKQSNKDLLCEQFNLDPDKPLFAFIGRLVGEKGADLLPDIIAKCLNEFKDGNFLILGSGDSGVEWELQHLKEQFHGNYNVFIGYNEELSHRIYAGADFLLMPSRVEPCGLNQFYAMRYGTIPVVRDTGGLHDTVIDYSEKGGYGIRFKNASIDDVCYAVGRGLLLYKDAGKVKQVRELMMGLDFSWDRSANDYIELYRSLKS